MGIYKNAVFWVKERNDPWGQREGVKGRGSKVNTLPLFAEQDERVDPTFKLPVNFKFCLVGSVPFPFAAPSSPTLNCPITHFSETYVH